MSAAAGSRGSAVAQWASRGFGSTGWSPVVAPPRNRETSQSRGRAIELIVIGCSLGGMHALQVILSSLKQGFCVPIAVAQHRHKKSNEGLPAYFRRETDLKVVDAEDKQWIQPGHVYLAPADYHLLIERNGPRGELSLSVDERVHFSRPSIDVLFESAADAYSDRLAGIVLTGSNDDGAQGAARIKARGGIVIAQDPATAEAPTMPSAAIKAAHVDRILRLEEIAPFLIEVCQTTVSHS
ncbi:MAG: two-component system, chemotaxis family, protein-glutamate methylesterase/glutaminase [Thermoanaerobaculia bacterium]|jgi:two-component system chemotaxis response regulator CheB|nr:two-component system, chemotaxis family, protein-glutamate methylesterase/glutaminase [Thermoanaerobaculia bacterium]